jgi:hypothetical protein
MSLARAGSVPADDDVVYPASLSMGKGQGGKFDRPLIIIKSIKSIYYILARRLLHEGSIGSRKEVADERTPEISAKCGA